MQIKNKEDFWSGIMFAAIGAGFAIGATSYSMGTSARMGPGYFPFWLGICLAVLGAIVSLGSVSKTAEHVSVAKFDFKLLGIVIGSVVGCGLILNYAGVYISIFLLVFFSSMASFVFSWKVAVINGICLMVFVWLAFIKGLGLIFPLWPSFLNM